MSGFKSPNHTQVPNDFFDMIPDMSDAELRVTLIMIRETRGWHRDATKLGKQELADRSGLSFNGATAGCEAAASRGTFRRTNPAAKTRAEWELIEEVEPSVGEGVEPHNPQPVREKPSVSEGQVGVKERIKKGSKESKKILQKSDPAWLVLSGENMSQEEIQEEELKRKALEAFEVDMNMPKENWSWYPARSSEDPAWKLLREFVVEQYKKDKKCFQTYQTWRTQPFARGAMSNLAIKKNPENFPASWTDFLASNAMYGKPVQPTRPVDTDENDVPISY